MLNKYEADSKYRMNDECKNIPSKLNEEHGYHRECYQIFTKNRDRLAQTTNSEPNTSSGGIRMKRRSLADSDKVLFNKACIFRNKEGRKWKRISGKIMSENTALFDMDGFPIRN